MTRVLDHVGNAEMSLAWPRRDFASHLYSHWPAQLILKLQGDTKARDLYLEDITISLVVKTKRMDETPLFPTPIYLFIYFNGRRGWIWNCGKIRGETRMRYALEFLAIISKEKGGLKVPKVEKFQLTSESGTRSSISHAYKKVG